MTREYTHDDFDNWGITDEWSAENYSGDDWWGFFNNTNETGDWEDPSTGNGAGWDLFGNLNNLARDYYNFDSNRAIRGARLEQIRLQGAIPLPNNNPNNNLNPNRGGNSDINLITAGAMVVGVLLLLNMGK